MSAPVIAVIDNGICNLRSVTKALEAVGAAPRVVHTPDEVEASRAVGLVLPGVGALRGLRGLAAGFEIGRDLARMDRCGPAVSRRVSRDAGAL
jgi:imidazoleglycerol phosphate synthase glutamine amidotransferase subunit HisH